MCRTEQNRTEQNRTELDRQIGIEKIVHNSNINVTLVRSSYGTISGKKG